ncbi:hypothetical protein Leryth_008047 [Lithospermum erythrorhizon]|nr:hypothetical protein Leryth_008047 [Lithospermum erythrorhizon]
MGLMGGYVHVGTCRISPDHKFLAYTLDANGSEHFVLHIKDLQNNIVLPQFRVEGVVSLAWASDDCSLFYTLTDKNQRPYRQLCCSTYFIQLFFRIYPYINVIKSGFNVYD